MKKFLIFILILLTSCYKEINLPTTPLILCFPSGKPWAIEQFVIGEEERTELFSGLNMWFYNPIGSDPNFGTIETYLVNGTWRYEVVNGREFLDINFPPLSLNVSRRNPFLGISGRWEIQNKWSNRIVMTDFDGNLLKIRVR